MIGNVYVPEIKKHGFCPNPVAGNIPIYADSITNPKCIGTLAYEEFWNEQINRCINGYDTAGVHISGRYYFFLNFKILPGLKGPQYPFFVDMQKEYFDLIEWVKKNRKPGIVGLKARRKGLSEIEETILAHGIRFIEDYRAAVTAGMETYVTGIKNKFEYTQKTIIQDLRLSVLENNDKTYKIGYAVRNPIGGFVEEGYGGFLSFETMFDNPTKLEGEYFHDVLCEESGRYKYLGKVITSIQPALEFGSQMLGTFYIYGTGGNILSTSKDFKEIWDHAEAMGFVKFWVPGSRMYYPFFGNNKEEFFIDPDNGSKVDSMPNLRKFSKEQRIGMEDTKAAEEYIIRKRVEYAKLPNKKKLKEHNQAYPLTIEEAFTSGGSNNFNDEKIYNQLFDIEGDPNAFTPVVLEWVTDSTGQRLEGEEMVVKHRPATANDPDWKIVWVYQFPKKEMLDLDIGGIDGYNQDQTQTSSSQGAMTVVRQGNKVNMVGDGIHKAIYPVCLYYKRPPRKEEFYDVCLKISVWYRLIRNTMANAEQDFVIDYFMKNGGARYLSPRPKAFDSPKSQQVHKLGAKMTGYSKEIILGIVQTYVENYIELNRFPAMLRDLLAYDEEYIGTDWDSVDALAYALMRIEDMKTRPRKADDDDNSDIEPEWGKDEAGNLVIKNKEVLMEKPKERKSDKDEETKNLEYTGRWKAQEYKERKRQDDNERKPFDYDEHEDK
jgi:hypothetical protein